MNTEKTSLEKESQPSCLAAVICSSREVNPNFKMETFKKKVELHIKCGYSKELAEWKVLGDFNRLFFKSFGTKPNKRQTDSEGYYI
jgi:phosphatidate phosphatase APP1